MTLGNRESSLGELAAAYIDLHGRMEKIAEEANRKEGIRKQSLLALAKGTQ